MRHGLGRGAGLERPASAGAGSGATAGSGSGAASAATGAGSGATATGSGATASGSGAGRQHLVEDLGDLRLAHHGAHGGLRLRRGGGRHRLVAQHQARLAERVDRERVQAGCVWPITSGSVDSGSSDPMPDSTIGTSLKGCFFFFFSGRRLLFERVAVVDDLGLLLDGGRGGRPLLDGSGRGDLGGRGRRRRGGLGAGASARRAGSAGASSRGSSASAASCFSGVASRAPGRSKAGKAKSGASSWTSDAGSPSPAATAMGAA